MPNRPTPPDVRAAVERMLLDPAEPTFRDIKAATGASLGTISKIRDRLDAAGRRTARKARTPGVTGLPDAPPAPTVSESGDRATVIVPTLKPIRTLDDAIAAAQVDTLVWYVDKWESTAWTVGMKQRTIVDGTTTETPVQTQQHGVKVWLKRLLPRSINTAVEAIFRQMKKHAPKYAKPPRVNGRGSGEPYLAVFGLFDVHFGKLCWSLETGDNYDLKIADRVFRNAVTDLMRECASRRLDSILLPVGNDWLHIDNRDNTTTRGTPQDVDGRHSKVFLAAKLAAIWAVEQLSQLAPVRVEWVPGNHDKTVSEYLCHVLDAWFHKHPGVEVNLSPKARKYVLYGVNLLGLTHGDTLKPNDLPSLMATEAPELWAGSTCREWLIGHMHRSREWVTKPVDTHHGTTVRVLRALTGTDAYHYENGYVGAAPAAEVYFYGKTRGYAGHAVVNARG